MTSTFTHFKAFVSRISFARELTGRIGLLMIVVTQLLTSGTSSRAFAEIPQQVSALNKRFVYHIFWSGIRAGTAVMDVEVDGDTTTIKTHATSAPFVSFFYPVDDYSETVIYPDGYPKSFTLKISEGRHKRDKVTMFEPLRSDKPQKVTYYNRLENEKKKFWLSPPAYDPLSAFYAMSKMPLEPGQSQFIDIFDNKKAWHTEVQVIRREKVSVPAGEFNTLMVKPLLESEGIFRKTGEVHIWALDGPVKIPVLLKSKAIIGVFTVELAEGSF